jgi:hypothetical protein
MPRGTGSLYSGLVAKRRELEQAIETIDNAIRLIHGKGAKGQGRSKPRGPMSEETKAKLRAAHAKRKKQAEAQSTRSRQPHKGRTPARTPVRAPLGVRTRPRQQEDGMEVEA